VFLAACGALTALGADSETDAFIKEVTKTARSDADRMTMLAEAAALTEDNKTLRIALLEKALEYGAKAPGQPTTTRNSSR